MDLNIQLRDVMKQACLNAVSKIDKDDLKVNDDNVVTLINSLADTCSQRLAKLINSEMKRILSETIGQAAHAQNENLK